MHIDELVIEITRRCNAACWHCMRGDAQDKDISNDTVDKILEGVTSIGTITFTGGEPSLAVDRIQYIYEQIRNRSIDLQGFYVVTNGKIPSRELMHVLIDLYEIIEYPNDGTTVLSISRDQYHADEIYPEEADHLYRALKFYEPDHRKDEIKILINEGRAYENGGGKRDAYISSLAVRENAEGTPEGIEGTVYVNVLGDVIPSCDMSYESQMKNKMGNVHDKPLSEILLAEVSKGVA